jgi:uncharacterized protein HemX
MESGGGQGTPGGKPETGAQPATGSEPTVGAQPAAESKPAGAQPAAGAQPGVDAKPALPPTTEERLETLEASVTRVERKLGVRSYAGGAALVLALAAGIVGVVLAVSAKDESATKADARSLHDQIESVQRQAATAAEDDIATLNDRLDALEGRVNTVASSQRTSDSELSVVQDDIDDLRNQISDLERTAGSNPPAGGGTGKP